MNKEEKKLMAKDIKELKRLNELFIYKCQKCKCIGIVKLGKQIQLLEQKIESRNTTDNVQGRQ